MMKLKWKVTVDKKILIYSLLFGIIIFLGYFPIWKEKLSIIWNVDGIGQYYPAFLYIGQYLQRTVAGILQGNFILPLYDLSIGMGEDIIGALNYYGFGDPINLLSIFVNADNGVFWYSFTFFLRLWLAGLSFQAYCDEMKVDTYASLLGSLAYAFCGFAIYGGGRYIEWLSVLIYFPLLLLGTERTIKKRKNQILVLSVLYGALCGFYYLYMASLCLGIYWIARLVANYRNKWKSLMASAIRLGFGYILGLGLSAPVFIPAVSAFFNSERSGLGIGNILFDISNYIPVRNDNLLIVLLNFFHYRLQNFSGVLIVETLALIILLMIHNKATLQLKIALGLAFAAFHLPITGWLFNAFGETNDRWVFWIHFLFAFIFAYILGLWKDVKIEGIGQQTKIIRKKVFKVGISVVVLLNIIANILILYSDKIHGYGWKAEMISYQQVKSYVDSPVNYSKVLAKDNELYRIANTTLTNINGRPENVAMLNDYLGVTWWYSIINSDTQNYVNELLQYDIGWRSFGLGNNSTYETFSGVKYYLSRKSEAMKNDYVCMEEIEFNGELWNLYENPNYFGLAYKRDVDESNIMWETKVSYESYYKKIYNEFVSKQNEIQVIYDRGRDRFSCFIDTESKEEVVFLVPYHRNWKAYVDGIEVKPQKTDIAYISVIPGEGEHEILLKYESVENRVGWLICLLCLFTFMISEKRSTLKHFIADTSHQTRSK